LNKAVVTDDERTTGRRDQIQGARIVIRPEIKAKNNKTNI